VAIGWANVKLAHLGKSDGFRTYPERMNEWMDLAGLAVYAYPGCGEPSAPQPAARRGAAPPAGEPFYRSALASRRAHLTDARGGFSAVRG
jgi:hypothetical protein